MRDQPRQHSAVSGAPSVLAYDIETISPPVADGSFPPWPTHQVVAIGFARAACRENDWTFDLDAMVASDQVGEEALVREADKRMAAASIVTSFNGRQFDALVLRLAAQRCRLWNLKALANHAASNRYGGEHADLADLYASYGRKVSLSAICDEVGIPVKTSVNGGDVAALWAAGEHEKIRAYVLEDAVATLCLYHAWAAARAADEALVTRPLAGLARHIEATPALHHLQPFVDCQLMWWARPRAMKADIGAALARLTLKLKREEEERAFASP